MKSAFSLFACIATICFFQACAPVYKCGEAKPEKQGGSKRLKAVVSERDVLCTDLSAEKSKNEKLRDETANQKADIEKRMASEAALQKKYDELGAQSAMNEEQYSVALQQKSEELKQKEKQLAEREKALRDMKSEIARRDSITKHLNDVLRNALLGFNSDELSVEIKNGKVYVSMSDKLLFKSGSAAVETKGKEALRALADVLLKNQDIDVLIEGHTDNVPIKTAVYKDNWDLSVARATSIVRILTDEYYLTPQRVTASGKGEFQPKESNETAEGRAKNRRTEIILSPKLDEIMNLLNGN